MRPVSKSRLRRTLTKHGPVSYGKLVGLLRNSPGISDLLRSMEQQGEVSRDPVGRLLYGTPPTQAETDHRFVTGIATKEAGRWVVLPLRQLGVSRVPLGPDAKMTEGNIVTVDLGDRKTRKKTASIKRIIAVESEADRAALGLLHAYEVPHEDDESTYKSSIPKFVDKQSIESREDLRSLSFVTIDGESARDFDDAVFANKENGEKWRLRVAIADVAHYVEPGGAIDAQARNRGNSVYLPDRVVPMLPHELSSGICSLKPDEDRLVVVCDIVLSQDGLVETFSFYEAVIRSVARLTYKEAFQVCSGRTSSRSREVIRTLISLHQVFKVLKRVRENRGALDFTTRESSVKVNDGEPVGIEFHNRNDAHSMIEEAMILANVCAARFLLEHDCPTLFRVHEGPDSKSLGELRRDLIGGSIMRGKLSGDKPLFIKQLLDKIRSKSPTPWIWELQVLRSMKQAMYSFENVGHFGLALEDYVHFTSPIRRYSDLFVHRLIKSKLNPDSAPQEKCGVPRNLGSDLSFCERRSVEVTRRVESWLKCVLLKKEIGRTFLGHVVKIEAFGLFVELDRYMISGLIHVSELENDFYENRITELVGENTGKTYRLGESMNVRLTAVDVEQQRLDLVDANASEVGQEYRRGKRVLRRGGRRRS